MTGMESLDYAFKGTRRLEPFGAVLVGVLGSGNLEVMVEAIAPARGELPDGPPDLPVSRFHVETSARGFGSIWEAVLRDFHERHDFQGLSVSINDMGATPAVVSLRLDQAVAELKEVSP